MENREHFDTPQEYAIAISYSLSKMGEGEMMEELLDIWCDDIYHLALNSYKDYLAGKKKDYHLTDEEVTESYKKATIQVTQNTLSGLLDKEMIELQVAENGNIVYSLTENGKTYLEELKKEDEEL
jgi:hypothetical protein